MLNNIKLATKDTFIYSLGNISTKIIGLVLLPLYTEKLSVAEYGVLGTVEITIQVLVAAFNLSLYQALNRWYWDKQYVARQKSIFFTTLVSLIILSILMLLFFLPLTGTLSGNLLGSPEYSYLFTLLLISASFQILARGVLSLMRLQRKPLLFTTTNIAKLIITLFLTLYLVIVLNRGIEGIFEAQIIGFLFFILINVRFITRNSKPIFEWAIFKEMIQFSYPLALSSVSSVLLTVADRYTVRYLEGMESMGLYSAGFKIANVLKVFIIHSLSSALMPLKFQMMDRPNNKRFYSKIMTYTAFGFIIAMLGLSLFSKEVIRLLAQDPGYWSAYHFVPILCFAQLFELLRSNANFGLIIKKKTKIISGILIFISFITIGLNAFFVSYFGAYGAAVATLLSQIVFFTLIYQNAQKKYQIPYELVKLGKMILVALIIVLVTYVWINPMMIIPRILLKLLLILLFPVFLYFLNFYEPIELIRLKQSWNKWKNPKDWGENMKNIRIK